MTQKRTLVLSALVSWLILSAAAGWHEHGVHQPGYARVSTWLPQEHVDPSLQAPTTYQHLKFAVIGDYGSGSAAESDVADLISGWSPDLIITAGDNNYPSGEAATIDGNIGQFFADYIGDYSGGYGDGSPTNVFFPSLGNHDWATLDAQPYLDYFTLPGNERYYDFVVGPVHFFALDSDTHEPDGVASTSTQATWLQSKLATSTSAWNIVYFHHAPYSSGPHGSTAYMQWPFEDWGASAVIGGHDHTYERLLIGSIPFFVNGIGGRSLYDFGSPISGSQLRYNDDYGAMQVDATDLQITYSFYTRSGELIDYLIVPNLTERLYFPIIVR